MADKTDDFDYLRIQAEVYDKPMAHYRLGRYYLEKTDEVLDAEFHLKRAADKGNVLAA